jgi:hypothetical protein
MLNNVLYNHHPTSCWHADGYDDDDDDDDVLFSNAAAFFVFVLLKNTIHLSCVPSFFLSFFSVSFGWFSKQYQLVCHVRVPDVFWGCLNNIIIFDFETNVHLAGNDGTDTIYNDDGTLSL